MELEVTTNSGTKTKTMVMVSDPMVIVFDPLAVNGALYYYHPKTNFNQDVWWLVLLDLVRSGGSNLSKFRVYALYPHNGRAGFQLGL